ncbi:MULTISPECIES: NADP-dependent oxidoreductase [unclassified Mycobacterium]|uniref:NADP-dependent oxidoreductase n=1 Tax=unclassified Mycobacterium TaxID=2642494 RepID=UPI0029C8A57B|nr:MULTISPECIES: NADP-dependent oxidoreductase [unclassified Mycobacterium]
MPVSSREWHLATRPIGQPKPTDFACITTTVADPGPDQILVRNDWLSVDPYMVGRLNAGKSRLSDIPPYETGEALTGGAVGTVIASHADTVPVGAIVSHFLGWREYALLPANTVQVVDTAPVPAQSYLGVLGVTGLTAYAALTVIAPVKAGDVVYVSAAAGAVGSVAGQIAKHLGASRVIGSAGGPDKIRRLVEDFGYDTGLDYRAGNLPAQLATAAPGGIDVYLDNVGGDHLQAALGAMNVGGRIALCGAISALSDGPLPPGPSNLPLVIGKRLTLRGINVADHYDLLADYTEHAIAWLQDGSLGSQETVVDGIDNAVEALLTMMGGANTGKMLIRLPPA